MSQVTQCDQCGKVFRVTSYGDPTYLLTTRSGHGDPRPMDLCSLSCLEAMAAERDHPMPDAAFPVSPESQR